ncbi:MAG: hypothetical protein E7409_05855 [Ruminococcaceae bacterium]|nr:hypothetical protein [Oscillospiraceae bacterium]
MKKRIQALRGYFEQVDLFGDRFLRGLFCAGVICAGVVLVAQIGLRNPVARTFLTRMEDYEGAVQTAQQIGAAGSAVLVMDRGTPCAAVEILLNGEPVEVFDALREELQITVPSVVEVVSHTSEPVCVGIESVSDNLYLQGEPTMVEVSDGYCVLGRIGFR